MKAKKALTAFLICAVAASLTGCNFGDLGTESLIRPPKTNGDEAEIEQLISDTAEKDYILKYPKSGTHRSAIIMTDLDNDKSDEAIAFYCLNDKSKIEMHMLVMYCEKGIWKLSQNCIIEATDVDCIEFADVNGDGNLEILSGYSTYSTGINKLACHSFSDGETVALTVECNYSSFAAADFDSDGNSEVMVLSLFTPENEAMATLLDYGEEKNCLYAKSSAIMDPNIISYKNISVTLLENGGYGLIVDGALTTEEMNTQVIFFSNELSVLRNPLYKEKEKNVTQRGLKLLSYDINDDGCIEIPLVSALPHTMEEDASKVADRVRWSTISLKAEIPTYVSDTVANYGCNYVFKMKESWIDNTVTARIDDERTMSFYHWSDNNLGDKLFTVKMFDLAEWDIGKDSDGYTLIYKNENYAYAFCDANYDNEYSLSDDEIKTSFLYMPSIIAN